MNKAKIFASSVLVAGMSSGLANAATNAASLTALTELDTAFTIDTSWIVANGWGSLDSTKTIHTGAWDNPVTGSSDPCGNTWVGIYCDGDDKITHIEIPNAKMAGSLAAVLTALDGISADLVSLNLSSTSAADANALTGAIPEDGGGGDLVDFTALRYLALNDTGLSGDIPDLTALTQAQFVNFADNGFTTYTGPVGGTALHTLGLNGNTGMSGDLAATISNATILRNLSSDGTDLTGGLNPVENASASNGTAADSMTVTWAVPSEGVSPTAYGVQISNDDGVSWSGDGVSGLSGIGDVTTLDITIPNLADGSYLARITPKSGSLVGTFPRIAANVVVIDSSSTGTGGGTNTGGTNTGSSGSSSGGGAVFWLMALPLLGFFRRRR